MRLLIFGGLWLLFLSYAILAAPPDSPETIDLIRRLSIGQWQDINPWVVTLFNIMGIWPLAYSAILYADGRGQPVRAWPFVVGSFALGAFALLPYLALRRPNPTFQGDRTGWVRWLDGPWVGAIVSLGLITLLGYGWTHSNSTSWSDFIQLWQTRRFIHVMSLDCCALTLLFPTIVQDDWARRNGNGTPWLAYIPLLGAGLYLLTRPRLPDPIEPMSQS
jgi:hypothetical protein